MPISVEQLVKISGLNPARLRTYKWGEGIESTSRGVYLISTSKDILATEPIFESAPLNDTSILYWIEKDEKLKTDGKPATLLNIKDRLDSYWLADETILYIGKSNSTIGIRQHMSNLYNLNLGNNQHINTGVWLKTLDILYQLHVHYISCAHPDDKKKEMILNFKSQFSKKSKKKLMNHSHEFPFANNK